MLCSRTFIGEAGGIAAQDGEGVVRRERGFTDGRNKSVTWRHQTQTAAQRRHGQLRFQDVFCGRLVRTDTNTSNITGTVSLYD